MIAQFQENLQTALQSLLANKLRTALSLLGILIGVGAVVALLAAGQGVRDYIQRQVEAIGPNVLFVFPGGFSQSGITRAAAQQSGLMRPALTLGDARALQDPTRAPDIVMVAPVVAQTLPVASTKERMVITVRGVTPEYQIARNWAVTRGRFLTPEDERTAARVALLGVEAARRLFGEADPVGQLIRIRDVPFRVIGILSRKGGTSFGNDDEVILIPLSAMHQYLYSVRGRGGEPGLSAIVLVARSPDRIRAAQEQATAVLRERHGIRFREDEDFTVVSQEEILNLFGNLTLILTAFLSAIAGISLLVGGIGIMNITLVSVRERTREIGLRKAVGARRRDIMLQFLIETVLLALIGGFLGVLLGIGVAFLISTLAGGAFRAIVTPEAILLAVGISSAVGLAAGLYPAWRAARLDPIVALRYE
ncbi:ABC transporter permease [Thermoflexus hugenholtzii]|jgi:ABC-type antimicrobial peptide transport system, permease component|uniref:Putative ABC transport system permease protein n=1 Tax=Thermoflexus hugenholtzii JAD2 TaxID=877466 RepID=A0A212QZL6_9CHLR|nr:ABC transporter permease [Thermoflexus hugenholtzii]SNB65085.1 putative ABC transport system permease protein [Thermoflexus hugenholtzii JAD2]